MPASMKSPIELPIFSGHVSGDKSTFSATFWGSWTTMQVKTLMPSNTATFSTTLRCSNACKMSVFCVLTPLDASKSLNMSAFDIFSAFSQTSIFNVFAALYTCIYTSDGCLRLTPACKNFSILIQFFPGYLRGGFFVRHQIKCDLKRLALRGTKCQPIMCPEVVGGRHPYQVVRILGLLGEFLLRKDVVFVSIFQ